MANLFPSLHCKCTKLSVPSSLHATNMKEEVLNKCRLPKTCWLQGIILLSLLLSLCRANCSNKNKSSLVPDLFWSLHWKSTNLPFPSIHVTNRPDKGFNRCRLTDDTWWWQGKLASDCQQNFRTTIDIPELVGSLHCKYTIQLFTSFPTTKWQKQSSKGPGRPRILYLQSKLVSASGMPQEQQM